MKVVKDSRARTIGDKGVAPTADDRSKRPLPGNPRLRAAAAALQDDRPDIAENILREFLELHPGNVEALRLMAETAAQNRRPGEAAALLARCLAPAPDLASVRFRYAELLFEISDFETAKSELEILLQHDSRNSSWRKLYGAVLRMMGDYAGAISLYREMLEESPDRPDLWTDCGHALRSLGRTDECVAAYRKAIELCESLGGAYWSLANLKRFRFSDAEVAAMEAQLARTDLLANDRSYLHFSLGKAFEDLELHEKAFEHYARGNAIVRLANDYDPDVTTAYVARCREVFTPAFFHERNGAGCPAPDPIFIVGMPRAGSTLVEQILSSHSAIEGTTELDDITALARHLEEAIAPNHRSDYPGVLEYLDAAALKALGEDYLRRTCYRRRLGRPFFTDKMPNNYLHAGLIHSILPNAKIVDVRRHPLGCCFANFRQHFSTGQLFSYRQADLGRCYRDYVELMAHFDGVLPGRIHRVVYERLVADPKAEVTRLLAYLGLPFEESCLRFYETSRAVRTASSEQIRVPIYSDAVEQWRHYEQWLGPLKQALGPVLETWPGAPAL
ncbi:MAG TPA: sulfotransferase [Rhizomicrobium sp.]